MAQLRATCAINPRLNSEPKEWIPSYSTRIRLLNGVDYCTETALTKRAVVYLEPADKHQVVESLKIFPRIVEHPLLIFNYRPLQIGG